MLQIYRAPTRAALTWSVLLLGLLAAIAALWVGSRGLAAADELRSARTVASALGDDLLSGTANTSMTSTAALLAHTSRAVELTADPVWALVEHVPFVGANLVAVRQSAVIVDALAADVVRPLVPVAESVDSASFAGATIDLEPLAAAAPTVSAARDAIVSIRSATRAIEGRATLPVIRDAVAQLSELVETTATTVESLDRATTLLPGMLGGGGTRNYLLLVQNSAELRASGGIVGATAILSASDGVLTVSDQKSTRDYPRLDAPVLPLTPAEANLHGEVLGQYIMDVNLTPDFARSARLAIAMAEPVYGIAFDGAITIDPYVLEGVLAATGPVAVGGGVVLDADNAVRVLLSDVYRDIPDPRVQDEFFGVVTTAVFSALSSGSAAPRALLDAIGRGAAEGRVKLFSTNAGEQAVLAETSLAGLPLSGDIAGVYLNDATGAKMGFYLDVEAELSCNADAADGADHRVAVTLSSSASPDAGDALPAYVTAGGHYGVPPGDIRTQVLVVLPDGASVISATGGDAGLPTIARDDSGHTVVSMMTQLSPGTSTTVVLGVNAGAIDALVGTPGIRFTSPERGHAHCSLQH